MSGVVALDPVRLAHLESYLETFATGCHRRAVHIEEELADTGFAAPDAVALLDGVARWSEAAHRDVAWRRAVIEGMAGELPLTRIVADPQALAADARTAATRLTLALGGHPPQWPVVRAILAEVGRRLHSAEYAATLLRYLGPALARDLALRIEASARAGADRARAGRAPDVDAYLAAQRVAARLVEVGVEVPAEEGGLDDRWLRQFMGLPPLAAGSVPAATEPAAGLDADEVDRVVGALGFGLRLSAQVATALEMGAAAPILGAADDVLGLVTATVDMAASFEGDDVCSLGHWGIAAASAGSGVAAVLAPAGPWTVALAGASFLARQASAWVGSRCDDRGDVRPAVGPAGPRDRVDPGTGVAVYPGGGSDSPHQDGAGGVLPPTMTRGG